MPPIAPITPPHNVQKKRKRHTATLAKASMYFLKAGFAWNSGIFSENYHYIPKDGLPVLSAVSMAMGSATCCNKKNGGGLFPDA
jgi:hypothetical protein